jgi:hypothetical protein
MNGLAALAVKEAAVASGHGSSFLPAIAPSALDGFAVGALVSALCVLLVMVPRHIARRSRYSALSAAPTPLTAPVAASSPFADESAEIVIEYPVRDVTGQLAGRSSDALASNLPSPQVRTAGGRSKHRQAGSGRHAAPPIGSGSRKASKLAL